MKKILSKKQQEIQDRKKVLPVEYKEAKEAGSNSWAIVDHLALKHAVSATTIYRDLKEAKAL